jgi:serine/threonine protein kinase
LSHPNIVTVHEYFEQDGTPYIAMEYVRGGSMRPWVGKLTLPQLGEVLGSVLAALAHAEAEGIVHRDLKPENIMITADGRVKIADFGISKATQRAGVAALTATGVALGTPAYMAPEQAGDQNVGPWTDLYSVGIIAHELLAGRTPFADTEAPLAILMRHANDRIPSLCELDPEIDVTLSGWVDRLLVKDPLQRTSSATRAWEELEEIILELAGPRWRRTARLLEREGAETDTASRERASSSSPVAAGEIRHPADGGTADRSPSATPGGVAPLLENLSTMSDAHDPAAAVGAPTSIDSAPVRNTAGSPLTPRAPRTSTAESSVPAPDSGHYDTLLEYLIEQGTVVPVLGSRLGGTLPDRQQLAATLAARLRAPSPSPDLAEVAQHIAVTEGPSFLHKAMTEALGAEREPSEVHRFLARFPRRLAELERPARYQMIVTTNYDTALERAFDAEGEPYDLAVFMTHGAEKGTFVHVPWAGEPRMITEPSRYRDFPIDPYDELQRTVIAKILGGAEGGEGEYRWDRSYVLTEDQYIDYMVTDQVGTVVPLQILNKLTSSHCLFLGYAMRDWSLRVFLKRIWRGRPLEDKSWAIEDEPDTLEKEFWSALRVELLRCLPDGYAGELDARMTAWCATGA